SGSTPAAAAAALKNAFLAGDSQAQTGACSPAQQGLVVSTSPGGGTLAPLGSEVTLNVCNTNVTVPNVLRTGDLSARNAITGAGLTVGTVRQVGNCTVAKGDVITQDPAGGAQVPRGTAVSLDESTGKKPNGKPCIEN